MATNDVRTMIRVAESVHVEDSVRSYVVRLCAATRVLPQLRLGVSTRGAMAMVRTARALAAAQGRPFVTPDDVRIVAPAVMGHRMLLTPEAELSKVDTNTLVDEVLDRVELPAPARTRLMSRFATEGCSASGGAGPRPARRRAADRGISSVAHEATTHPVDGERVDRRPCSRSSPTSVAGCSGGSS